MHNANCCAAAKLSGVICQGDIDLDQNSRAKCRTAWGTSPGEEAARPDAQQWLVVHIAHATTMRHRRRGFRFWLLGDHGLGSNEEASH